MASAGLMDFDSAFYGSTMLYDFFSRSDKTGLRNGKYPESRDLRTPASLHGGRLR